MNRRRSGFSMIELLVALMFVSFAFLPIYNLFRLGQRGTWSNEKEIVATNHAADLINFLRELSVSDLDKCFSNADRGVTVTDVELEAKLKSTLKLSLPPTDLSAQDFVRTVNLIRFDGGGAGFFGGLGDLWKERSKVPNFLVSVEVDYHKKGMSMGDDKVILSTIVLD